MELIGSKGTIELIDSITVKVTINHHNITEIIIVPVINMSDYFVAIGYQDNNLVMGYWKDEN